MNPEMVLGRRWRAAAVHGATGVGRLATGRRTEPTTGHVQWAGVKLLAELAQGLAPATDWRQQGYVKPAWVRLALDDWRRTTV